jgi:hypothetical protein
LTPALVLSAILDLSLEHAIIDFKYATAILDSTPELTVVLNFSPEHAVVDLKPAAIIDLTAATIVPPSVSLVRPLPICECL